jgi:hypothetical protein
MQLFTFFELPEFHIREEVKGDLTKFHNDELRNLNSSPYSLLLGDQNEDDKMDDENCMRNLSEN